MHGDKRASRRDTAQGRGYLNELLARTANGDSEAFAELYDETSSRVYGLVLRVLRNAAYSEEATQEVYLQIWRTADRYDPQLGSPDTWILSIAHRRAVDRVRSEEASAAREDRYGRLTRNIAYDEVVESVTRNLERENVIQCLQSLTDKQRETIWLAYYGGLTYSEVATQVGTGLPTVKSRIKGGLSRLRTCLGDG